MKRRPNRQECLRLLRKRNPDPHRIEHCILVADTALFLARKLAAKGEQIDLALLEAAALLHDIAKAGPGSDEHEKQGADALDALGFHEVAAIVRKHGVMGIVRSPPATWEEKLVCYADMRAKNRIMTLDERSRKWPDAFPQHREQILRSISMTKDLETEIFAKLDFGPEGLAALILQDANSGGPR